MGKKHSDDNFFESIFLCMLNKFAYSQENFVFALSSPIYISKWAKNIIIIGVGKIL